jgi:hypothetical protein
MSLLHECQQGIELLQIRRFHDDLRRGRKLRTRLRQRDHGVGGQGCATRQHHAQSVVDGDLAGVGRMVQDLQVVLGTGPLVAALTEPVVGQAEACRWEQVVAVRVLCERARLADQRVDDVPIVHRVLVATHQSRQRVNEVVRVPDLDAIGKQSRLDLLPDHAAVHRIHVAMNVHQTAGVHAAGHLQTRRQPCFGQVFERRQLLGETVLATRVPHFHETLQEARVLLAAGKLAAATQQQRLIDRGLEVPVRRFRIAVLVRLSHVDSLARQTVMRQQIAIASLEFPRLGMIVHGGSQGIAAVPPRHAAQFPQRVLQAVGKCLE